MHKIAVKCKDNLLYAESKQTTVNTYFTLVEGIGRGQMSVVTILSDNRKLFWADDYDRFGRTDCRRNRHRRNEWAAREIVISLQRNPLTHLGGDPGCLHVLLRHPDGAAVSRPFQGLRRPRRRCHGPPLHFPTGDGCNSFFLLADFVFDL